MLMNGDCSTGAGMFILQQTAIKWWYALWTTAWSNIRWRFHFTGL